MGNKGKRARKLELGKKTSKHGTIKKSVNDLHRKKTYKFPQLLRLQSVPKTEQMVVAVNL